MKKLGLCALFALASQPIYADRKLCEIYKWMACPDAFAASRSTTSSSFPLNSASAPNNPASMSVDRGTGIEVINLGSSYDVSLISGTGVIGSSFSVTNNEATFFGETPPETVQDNIQRRTSEDKFDSAKISALVAFQLLGKKKRNGFKLNLGILGRYNQDTSKISGGPGISMAWGPLSFGVAKFTNDFQDSTGRQNYETTSVTFGAKISNVAIDWTYLKNNAEKWSRVRLVTATLFTKNFLFTYGVRQEESLYPFEVPITLENLDTPNIQTFLGVQYIYKKNLIIGAYSNYYLLNSLSLGLTIFI